MIREIDHNNLNFIIRQIHKLSGIKLTPAKKTMILGRLRRRLAELNMESCSDYVALLKKSKEEARILINLITTHETSFFRTQKIWVEFEKFCTQKIAQTNGSCNLNIWSAATATGEEAYSLAFICEEIKKRFKYFKYSIEATDISSEVIKHAIQGTFSHRSLENLKKFIQSFMRNIFRKIIKIVEIYNYF